MGLFAGKMAGRDKPSLLFEVIPPPENTRPEKIAENAAQLRALLKQLPVDGINIPEIHNESRGGERGVKFIPKIEPRVYGKIIEQAFNGAVETVINRCSVRFEHSLQNEWLLSTWSEFGIKNLAIVGGELPAEHYHGPSVTEMAEIASDLNSRVDGCGEASFAAGFFCGGITIPGRENEPLRLAEKAKHGIEFFTSQVIYEEGAAKKLLLEYSGLAHAIGQETKRIFFSFAPVSCRKDIEFLKWLGVGIPPSNEGLLLSGGEEEVCRKSFELAASILSGMLEFRERESIDVPIGINVGHIMRHNLAASAELARALYNILKHY